MADEQSALSGLYDYLRNSGAGLARGARTAREFMDSVTPGPATVAALLPGAGVVQGAQDARNARNAFNQGQYGQAFGDAVSSVVNTGSEMLGPLGKAAPAILAGIGARTAPMDDLRRAFQMERAGATPDDIWREAGWERGKDTKWRFEIPDRDSYVNGETYDLGSRNYKTVPFGDLLNHPELYEAYPVLRGLPVVPEPGTGGAYYGSRIGLGVDGGIARAQDTLLHEGQHAVQGLEGFATGSNQEYIRQAATEGFRKAIDRANSPEEADHIKRLFRSFQVNASPASYDAYLATAGEAEARNVAESRAGLTPDAAWRSRPELTEDPRFPRAKQILPNYPGEVPRVRDPLPWAKR